MAIRGRQKTETLRAALKGLPVTALALSLPAIWILASPPFSKPISPEETTRRRLEVAQKVVKAATQKLKSVPFDVSELRAFARAEKLPLETRDAFGQPFSLTRLAPDAYVLQSFGADERPATMLEKPDPVLAKWGVWPKGKPLRYRYATRPDLDVFPAVLLVGAGSVNGVWVAKLFVDREAGTRYLVVRDPRRKDLFMIAPHDSVEEFLWLPDGHRILYSATASPRYRDGLYLWDLLSGETTNLIDLIDKNGPISPAAQSYDLFVSLAGIHVTGPTVYAYLAERTDAPLDPARFFAKSQLATFVVPEKGRPRFVPMPPLPTTEDPPFTRPLDLTRHIERASPQDGLQEQRRWLKLNLHGDLEKVLTAWQSFSEKETESALFPYCLWYLSSLYSESFSVLARGRKSQEADVLRAYGTEIARALLNTRLAPTYLRGLALYTYQRLMSGQALPYRFARLTTVALAPEAEPPVPRDPTAGTQPPKEKP